MTFVLPDMAFSTWEVIEAYMVDSQKIGPAAVLYVYNMHLEACMGPTFFLHEPDTLVYNCR